VDDEDIDPLILGQQCEAIALETNNPKDWAVAERAKQMCVSPQLLGHNDDDWLDDN
jgi:hypothetical protein